MNERDVDQIVVIVWSDGTIHTGTRGSGLSEVGLGTLVMAGCSLPGGALGKKKNTRHIKMLRGPLALRVVDAITTAGFSPGEIIMMLSWDRIEVGAYAQERRL